MSRRLNWHGTKPGRYYIQKMAGGRKVALQQRVVLSTADTSNILENCLNLRYILYGQIQMSSQHCWIYNLFIYSYLYEQNIYHSLSLFLSFSVCVCQNIINITIPIYNLFSLFRHLSRHLQTVYLRSLSSAATVSHNGMLPCQKLE